ncbi:hypothetical protein LPB88_23640, partial [Flavobacterium sp. JAS]|nr:hypothetical protein [Flavobacterium sp. JAS]
STFTQVITLEDTTKPTLVGNLPADVTVSCDAVPDAPEVSASDNCNTDLPVVYTETKSGIENECNTNYTLTRTWTTSDCSNNITSYTQIITVRDTTPPTGTVPADITGLQSIANIPIADSGAITDATDNCSQTVNITVTDTNNGASGCEGNAYILTRTYTLSDCAGNQTILVQTITVENKVSVSGIPTPASCQGLSDGSIAITNSSGSTVVVTNANNEVVGNTNLPAGTYTLTATSPVNNDNQNCTATATVTITEPNYKVRISGTIMNIETNTPLANVPVTLIPQGTTTGPVLLHLTDANGMYNFQNIPEGDYLLQVQDANLNNVYQLFPVTTSLFFTTLQNCAYQVHNFDYGHSKLPIIGDYVWYDTNSNGIQDEWYDANNDGVVTQNIPDSDNAIEYSKWEWIDFNGDGSYAGAQNIGELNAGGFGNALSPNIFVTGPNGYHKEIIIGIQGYYRDRPETENPYGDYAVELKIDGNLDTASQAMGATGLVKVVPNFAGKKVSGVTGKQQAHIVCGSTNAPIQTATITAEDLIHLDKDFGISCKLFADINAVDDSYVDIGCNKFGIVGNVLSNDLLNEGVPATIEMVNLTLVPNETNNTNVNITINESGNVIVLAGTPAGTYTYNYQICEKLNPTNCDSAVVTIKVLPNEVTTVTGTACNADTSPVNLLNLLPAGTPAIGTWIDTNNTHAVTGNILTAFGLALGNYSFEYKIQDELCPRSIILNVSVNDKCKVLSCGTILVHNAFSPNGDNVNDRFIIDSI